jgi:hypothetical protein
MPTIEVLAYTPLDMDQFISYCINGKPDGMGDYETDEDGRKITGVFRWLHGRLVPEAHFFHSARGNDVQLFAATIQRLENYDVPWMRRIPGFLAMVKDDGLIGRTQQFAPLSNLLATVISDNALDQRYAQGRVRLNHLLGAMEHQPGLLSVGTRELLATLRGDIGTDIKALAEEVQERFGVVL